jgi:FtsH-binding integral membrane protein
MSHYDQGPQNPNYAPQQQNPPSYGWNQQAPQQQAFNDASYAENGQPKIDVNFNDASIRAGFVRKVFMLVTVMLAVVAIMTAIPFFHRDTMLFLRSSPGFYWLSYGTFLVVYFTLMCCENVRRSSPANLICTAILTLSMGYMTMMITSHFNVESVLMCLTITCLCCGGIVLFSMQTKYDLTSMMGFVAIASMVLLVFGLVAIIGITVFHSRLMYTIYAGLAALLFMVYLAIDIQMIMGGRKYEISPEDHIFAAIQVFLDIVNIFILLLSLFGSSNKD